MTTNPFATGLWSYCEGCKDRNEMISELLQQLAAAQAQRDTALEACRGVERKYLVTAAAVLRCQEAARMTPADAELALRKEEPTKP